MRAATPQRTQQRACCPTAREPSSTAEASSPTPGNRLRRRHRRKHSGPHQSIGDACSPPALRPVGTRRRDEPRDSAACLPSSGGKNPQSSVGQVQGTATDTREHPAFFHRRFSTRAAHAPTATHALAGRSSRSSRRDLGGGSAHRSRDPPRSPASSHVACGALRRDLAPLGILWKGMRTPRAAWWPSRDL